MKYDCLIIDDERPLAYSTSEYFNHFGIKTSCVYSETECMEFFIDNTADVILLDINLVDSSGFTLCKKLRETINVPILFISARSSDDDVLIALNIGGDDYIQKPYSLSILLAKVKAVLNRCHMTQNASESETAEEFHFGNIIVDYKRSRLLAEGNEVKLKALEYKLLCYMIENKNRALSKEELFEKVWNDHFAGDGTLNVHIRHLREKIEKNPNEPVYIKTIWGIGYIFEV